MNLDQDFFQVSKLSEDQKKGLHQKWNTTFFSLNSSEDQKKKRFSLEMEHFFLRIQVQTCAQMHTRVKLLEGMQMKTILKLLGGYSQIIWGIYPPIPPLVSTPLGRGYLVQSDKEHNDTAIAMNKERMLNFSICCIGSYLLISFIFFQNFILYCRVPSNVLAYRHVPKFF